MSLSKPVLKQPRTAANPNPSTLRRCETDLSPFAMGEEEKNRHMASLRTSSPALPSAIAATDRMMKHPRGHKVRELAEVWKIMDSQDFLHLTDSLALGDVWVQPTGVVSAKGGYATVSFLQIVDAPHIKYRNAVSKMSLDDLTKMLYLNDCLQWDAQNLERISFDDWLKDKSSVCVKAKGMEVGSDRAQLCNFIITEDREFSFCSPMMHNRFGVFFRKICYHSYKTSKDDESFKLDNPSMMKCKGVKGSFEYIIEARFFPLPLSWFDEISTGSSTVAASTATEPF